MAKEKKLYLLLQSLDPAELDRFRDFLRSPYLVSRGELSGLFDLFLPYLRGESGDWPAEATLFAHWFPGEKFSKKKLSYPLHYLNAALEQFLGLEYYQRQEWSVQLNEVVALGERGQEKHFQYRWQKLDQELLDSGLARHRRLLLQQELAEEVGLVASRSGKMEAYRSFHQQSFDRLNEFYFLRALQIGCESLNHQRIFSVDFQLPFLEEVVDYLSARKALPPLTAMYLHIYRTLGGVEEEWHFERLMALIDAHQSELSGTDMRDVYLFALNFCLRRYRQGQKIYSEKALYLYQEGIGRAYLYDGRYLSSRTFTNAVKQALVLGRFEWIEEFIEAYGEQIVPESRRDTLHFNLADYYYHMGAYDRVLTQLQKLRFSDLHYHLGSRVILLKTYFHLQEMDALLSLLASFSVYLRRKKELSQGLKKTYLNFCQLLHRLLSLKPGQSREAIREQIRKTNPLTDRAWLLEVVDQEKIW